MDSTISKSWQTRSLMNNQWKNYPRRKVTLRPHQWRRGQILNDWHQDETKEAKAILERIAEAEKFTLVFVRVGNVELLGQSRVLLQMMMPSSTTPVFISWGSGSHQGKGFI